MQQKAERAKYRYFFTEGTERTSKEQNEQDTTYIGEKEFGDDLVR